MQISVKEIYDMIQFAYTRGYLDGQNEADNFEEVVDNFMDKLKEKDMELMIGR